MKSKLTEDDQKHLAELIDITERLMDSIAEAPGEEFVARARKVCHDCNVVIWDIACGCECDVSAGVLTAARELLEGAA